MNKSFICIICPRGCQLEVDEKYNVSGNFCPRGAKYGQEEAKEQRRILTTTIRIKHANYPYLAVRTRESVPFHLFPTLLKHIKEIEVSAPIVSGALIEANILETGVDLIASATMEEKKC